MKNKNQKRIRNRAWAWIVTAGLTIGSLTGCVSQTVEQSKAIWSGMTADIVNSLDSKWGTTSSASTL
jgi:hypothetical protein